MDTTVYKGERFEKERILDVRTHFKPTETFQYTHFNSCHPAGVKNGFVKGEALRLLTTNSSKSTFEENIENFKTSLILRGYSEQKVDNMAISKMENGESRNGERGTGNGERGISKIGNL